MKEISSSFLENLEKNSYKINFTQLIDWDNDGAFNENEDVSDYFISGNISKKLEGDLGVNVIDAATTVLNNSKENFSPKNLNGKWSGNIIPNCYSEIKIGINDSQEKILLFDGYIQEIKPNFNKQEVTLKFKDVITILQNTDCPNKFYNNYRREEIIKEWLDIVGINYTDNTIDRTVTTINDSFDDKNMWEAIQELARSVWADVYIENGTFYFKTRLSPDYDGEQAAVYTFSTDNEAYDENIFEIEEEYTSKNLYNEVTIISKPLIKQSKQAIWTGTEEETEIQEEYNGDNIYWDNNKQAYVLQLTYVPEDETNELPTKNVPIIPGTINVYNINTDTTFLYNDGIKEVDYDSGKIYFNGDHDNSPAIDGDSLRVTYEYYFNKLSPNGERLFYIDLDNPAINIENLNILAKKEDNEELTISHYNMETGSFLDPTADILVKQEVFESYKRIKVNIINQTSSKVILYGYYKNKEDTKDTPILIGEPFERTNILEITEKDQESIDTYTKKSMSEIRIDYINSEDELKKLAQYLLYQYSTPKSVLTIKTKPLPHLELMDKVHVNQKNRDIDNDFFIKEIKHIFKNGKWEMELKLEQAQSSNWIYEERGTPVLGGIGNTGENEFVSLPIVSGVNVVLLKASAKSNSKVEVNWNKSPAFNLNHYNIYRRLEEESEYTIIDSVDFRVNNYIDDTVEYGKKYYYKVTVIDNNGNESELSNEDMVEIVAGLPGIIQWDKITWFADKIELVWQPHPDEKFDQYEITVENG